MLLVVSVYLPPLVPPPPPKKKVNFCKRSGSYSGYKKIPNPKNRGSVISECFQVMKYVYKNHDALMLGALGKLEATTFTLKHYHLNIPSDHCASFEKHEFEIFICSFSLYDIYQVRFNIYVPYTAAWVIIG